MKYLLIFLAVTTTTLYAETYEGKNGRAAHNRHETAVQTSNGTAVHARGISTVHSTNGAYHATGANGAAVHTNNGTAVHTSNGTAVHTDANWNDAYWHSNKYGYWNGQHGYCHVVNGKHVFSANDPIDEEAEENHGRDSWQPFSTPYNGWALSLGKRVLKAAGCNHPADRV